MEQPDHVKPLAGDAGETPRGRDFRLSFLASPSYLSARISEISSPRDALRRVGGVFIYVWHAALNSARSAVGAFSRLWLRGVSAFYSVRGLVIIAGCRTAGLYHRCRGHAIGAADRAYNAAVAVFRRFSRLVSHSSASFKRAPMLPAQWLRRLAKDRLSDLRTAWSFARLKAEAQTGRNYPQADLQISGRPVLWLINTACNYRCPYCCFHEGVEAVPEAGLTTAQYISSWERFNSAYGPANIELLGGEPFLMPGLADVLAGITAKNSVVITTNLFWDPALVIGRLDPRRVRFVASYHPSREPSPERFAEKIQTLRAAGFFCIAAIVAWPPYLEKLAGWLKYFYRQGIFVLVHPFNGVWEGRRYPAAYTMPAARTIRKIDRGDYLKQWQAAEGESAPSLEEVRKLARSLVDFPLSVQFSRVSPRGKSCNAGFSYFRVLANGDIMRCGQGGRLGNFYTGDLGLLDGPAPCQFDHCACIGENAYMEGGTKGPAAAR